MQTQQLDNELFNDIINNIKYNVEQINECNRLIDQHSEEVTEERLSEFENHLNVQIEQLEALLSQYVKSIQLKETEVEYVGEYDAIYYGDGDQYCQECLFTKIEGQTIKNYIDHVSIYDNETKTLINRFDKVCAQFFESGYCCQCIKMIHKDHEWIIDEIKGNNDYLVCFYNLDADYCVTIDNELKIEYHTLDPNDITNMANIVDIEHILRYKSTRVFVNTYEHDYVDLTLE